MTTSARSEPTAAEIGEAKALAVEVDASAARMEIMLDRSLRRLEEALGPARGRTRREEIVADLRRQGLRLDLDRLAAAST